jgi:hypothetical protein
MSNSGEKHIELNVELAHDFRDGGEDNLLVVNNGNHHQIFEKIKDTNHAHTITWTLTGNASGGEFCALDEADNPGFLWLVRTPRERIFHKLHLIGKTKLTSTTITTTRAVKVYGSTSFSRNSAARCTVCR